MLKKIGLFVIILAPWFLSSLFPFDYSFYNNLQLPFFAPPRIIFPIVWTIIYITIAISIYQLIKEFGFKNLSKNYKWALLINYLWNQSFAFLFFGLQNTFLGFVSSTGTLISSLFLYEETSKQNEKSSNLLNLYVLWNLFATILSLTVYILNIK